MSTPTKPACTRRCPPWRSASRSARQHVTLDSYIISLTPYDDLRKRYGDGSWDREQFAAAHILFMERHGEYDYLARLFADQMAKRQA